MKKLLLSFGFGLLLTTSFGQIIVNVEAPAAISGPVISFEPATTWAAQLSDPLNAVTDTVEIANDSLACAPITNLAGKIAMIYRGTCNFSAKAFAAQNAGAVAVIIVNNVAGPAAGMSGGTEVITIPVVMVSQADGAAIHNQIMSGQDVVVFMGQQAGHYANDLGFTPSDLLRANGYGIPSDLAQNAADFSIDLGAEIHNPGQNNRLDVTVNAKVMFGATELYNETSEAVDVPAGDSVFVTLPVFSETTYAAGEYSIIYTILNSTADDFTGDNMLTSKFNINDSIYSLAKLDATGLPKTGYGVQPNPFSGTGFTSCIVFTNPHGSRIGAEGMYFSAYTNTPNTLDGEEIRISVSEWTDEFTDLNDPAFAYDNVDEIGDGSFSYVTDDQGLVKYAAFNEPVILQDDTRYMFCMTTFVNTIFHGYEKEAMYETNEENDLQPLYPILNGTTYSIGFASGVVPGLAVKTFSNTVGLEETAMIETTTFPNPAKDVVTVKVNNADGSAVLNVTDLAGRTVRTVNVAIENGQFVTNVADFKAGTYIFSLAYANGANSQFKVVVAK